MFLIASPPPPPEPDKALRAYRATADHLFSVVLDRRSGEQHFLRWNGGKAAKTHPKAHAHRAWRRNAERMQRKWH